MWFGKWFGRQADDDHENDEPARFSAPQRTAETCASTRGTHTATSSAQAKPKNKKGFDPYNSGAFERKNAWERTNLR